MSTKKDDDEVVIHVHYKTILSVIFAFLLAISLIASIFFYNLKTTVANPEFYKSNLSKANIYGRLIDEGIPALITDYKISDDLTTNLLAKDAMIYIIKRSVPPIWVQSQVETIVDKIAEMFSKPRSNPNIVIKLDSMSVYLSQISDGINILEQIIPSCAQSQTNSETAKQLLNISIDCKSMSVNLDQIKSTLGTSRKQINDLKNLDLNLSQEIKQGVENINQLRQVIKDITLYTWISLVILIISVIFLIVMQYKHIYSLIKYLSLPVFIGSIVVLVSSLIMQSSIIGEIGSNLNFNLPVEMQSIVTDFAKTMAISFFYQMKIVSLILLILSLLGFSSAIILENHKK